MVLTRFYAKFDAHNYICYYLESTRMLNPDETRVLKDVLSLNLSSNESLEVLKKHEQGGFTEMGPKIEYTTPWSTHANMVLKRCKIDCVSRIEQTVLSGDKNIAYDRMTQTIYPRPIETFITNQTPARTFQVDPKNLAAFNKDQNLGFDQFDMDLYKNIWRSGDDDGDEAAHATTKVDAFASQTIKPVYNSTTLINLANGVNNVAANATNNTTNVPNEVHNEVPKTLKLPTIPTDEIDDLISEIDFSGGNHSFFKLPPEPSAVLKADLYDIIPSKMGAGHGKAKTHHHKLPDQQVPIYHDLILTPEKPPKSYKARVPSDVELYDLSQSNSEHSRHWLFRGKLELNGQIMPGSLMDMIRTPLQKLREARKLVGQRDNSLVAMADNSSAISGYRVNYFQPVEREYQIIRRLVHPIFTAETHNFPTGIAPFPGAATGTGGRIRDIQAMGRGGLMVAGTVGYCVGALRLKDDPETEGWEPRDFVYPLHDPAKILIEASNGASDYGNKIGEPLIQGFCRSYGMKLQTYGDDIHRLEWVKPIMFTGGVGQVFDEHVHKVAPQEGWLIVRLGGPAYRIGVGGGAASSRSQGELSGGGGSSAGVSGANGGAPGGPGAPVQEQQMPPKSKAQAIPKRKSVDFFGRRKRESMGDDDFESCSNSTSATNSKPGSLTTSSPLDQGVLPPIVAQVVPPVAQTVAQTADFNAVQRDDPEMENRLNKVIRTCIELGPNNPILSIHDQGAGGMANVTKEIVSPKGGLISLGNVHLGDQTMSAREKWVAEYQEQNTILIHPKNSQLLKAICQRENLPCQFVGFVSTTGRIQVYDPSAKPVVGGKSGGTVEMNPVDLNLEQVLENIPPKTFKMDISKRSQVQPTPINIQIKDGNITTGVAHYLRQVFRLASVGSKRFLTNKVDRSVGGLVVQQQCVGPFHTPLADVAVVAQSFWSRTGIATSVAEQPIKGLTDPVRMARMTVGEMLTNLVWAPITRLNDVKCSGNWMWEKKYGDEIYALYQAVKSVSDVMQSLGIAIDGGKDSLSMSARVNGEDVLCPRSLVLSAYVTCPDISKVVRPDLKRSGNRLIYVDLGYHKNRTGGSSLAQVAGGIGDEVPDLEQTDNFVGVFRLIQSFIMDDLVVSGHDRSDGGLITCLVEMAIAGNLGFEVDLSSILAPFDNLYRNNDIINMLFSEELGMVMEVEAEDAKMMVGELRKYAPTYDLGVVSKGMRCEIRCGKQVGNNPLQQVQIVSEVLLSQTVAELRSQWEETSMRLEQMQCNVDCVKKEAEYLYGSGSMNSKDGPSYKIPKSVMKLMSISSIERDNMVSNNTSSHQKRWKVAILREQGSNGDREMAAAFQMAGFDVSDITTQDLLAGQIDLAIYRGIAFVGGFSFADVLGAGRAWSLSLMSDPKVAKQLEEFKNRPDTFSLGICNGCQLMAELGWVPGKFVKNQSGRFESRWSTVKVVKSNAVLLQGLEGLQLPIWVAHGEGRYEVAPAQKLKGQAMVFVDDQGRETGEYPMNPNGSPDGVTGVASADGRHLAIMPHPERSIFMWQTPYVTREIKETVAELNYGTEEHGHYFPWLEVFRNANRWCQK